MIVRAGFSVVEGLLNLRNIARLYNKVEYHPISSPKTERQFMIDPSNSDIASTTLRRYPCNTLAFTCYSDPIPRLPFSICPSPLTHIQLGVTQTSSSSLPSLIQHISSQYFVTPKLSKQPTDLINVTVTNPNTTSEAAHRYNHLATKKKYKPVALKVCP